MNIESLRDFCLQFKGVTEEFPFDETTLVFKVMGKMFLLTDLVGDLSINVKCDPETAQELRERYSSVVPGYHMNKRHWNTILIDGSIPDDMIKSWIKDSYRLVVKGLSSAKRKEIKKD